MTSRTLLSRIYELCELLPAADHVTAHNAIAVRVLRKLLTVDNAVKKANAIVGYLAKCPLEQQEAIMAAVEALLSFGAKVATIEEPDNA